MRPAPRKASARSAGCSRSSPMTRPVKSDRARWLERRGARHERPAQPVGDAAGGVARPPAVDAEHRQLTGDVAGDQPRPARLDGSHRASHRDDLAGQARPQRLGGDALGAGLEASMPPAHVDPDALEVRRRVAQERDLAGHDPWLDAVEAVERPLGQPAGEQRHRHPAKHRPAERARPPASERHADRRANRCAGTSAPGRGRGRQRQGPAVAAHTVTRSRSASSLASPMPGTSSSWSTEVKAPDLGRGAR